MLQPSSLSFSAGPSLPDAKRWQPMYLPESKLVQHPQDKPQYLRQASAPHSRPSLSRNAWEVTDPSINVSKPVLPRGLSWQTPSWDMNARAASMRCPVDNRDAPILRQVVEPLAEASTGEEQHLDSGTKVVPWLAADVVENRRMSMRVTEADVLKFTNSCEFVSLGCFCGVTRALQCLDLKQHSYPFDWVRSDVAGITRCVQSGFKNFASSSFTEKHFAGKDGAFHGGAEWGGSFWHHNPKDPKDAKNFERRIDRLMGRNGEVAADRSRVFLISCNSSADVLLIPQLQAALQDMLPATTIYLLVFVDNQRVQGPVRLAGQPNVIFYTTGEELFANMGRLADGTVNWSEQKHAEIYALGLAVAIRAWAGIQDRAQGLAEVPNVAVLHSQCTPFTGGDCSKELYWPMRAPCQPQVELQLQKIVNTEPRLQKQVCGMVPWPLDLLF